MDKPLHATMRALFTQIQFSTLCRAFNFAQSYFAIRFSQFTSEGATLHIRASKTIQFQQRSLTIPLPQVSA